MPHFVSRTMVAVPEGERRVEELRAGSVVITRDHGNLPVQAITRRVLSWKQLARNRHQQPIFLRAGSLKNGLPTRDTMISPNLRMVVGSRQTVLPHNQDEVLTAAKHLVNNDDVHNVDTIGVTYYHLWLACPALVKANGCWAETYHPCTAGTSQSTNAQRLEYKEFRTASQSEVNAQAM